jgi:hypothetical protein
MPEKRLVIVAMIEPYKREVDDDVEVWVVNAAFRHQANADRIYFFDNIEDFPEGWADELNRLDCRIICRKESDLIPAAEEFPLSEVVAHFHGLQYYTCTVAYMIAHAIYEGFTHITLHGMYHPCDSLEYLHHIPCINFWVGVGVGMPGVQMVVSGNTMIAKPFPWQPKCYGYIKQRNEILANQTISAAYKASLGYPISFVHGDTGIPFSADENVDALVEVMPDGRENMQIVDLEG